MRCLLHALVLELLVAPVVQQKPVWDAPPEREPGPPAQAACLSKRVVVALPPTCLEADPPRLDDQRLTL